VKRDENPKGFDTIAGFANEVQRNRCEWKGTPTFMLGMCNPHAPTIKIKTAFAVFIFI
jgi:hypothetical protein